MAENLVIAAPDFDLVRKETGVETSNAVKLLWSVLNEEILARRRALRDGISKLEGKTLVYATNGNVNNFNTQGALLVVFTTTAAYDITGIRNPIEGRVVFFHHAGTFTITWRHQSASSDAANRVVNKLLADSSMAPDESRVFLYASARWRELSI